MIFPYKPIHFGYLPLNVSRGRYKPMGIPRVPRHEGAAAPVASGDHRPLPQRRVVHRREGGRRLLQLPQHQRLLAKWGFDPGKLVSTWRLGWCSCHSPFAILPGKKRQCNLTQNLHFTSKNGIEPTSRWNHDQDTLGIFFSETSLDLTCKTLFHQPQCRLRWGFASSEVTEPTMYGSSIIGFHSAAEKN